MSYKQQVQAVSSPENTYVLTFLYLQRFFCDDLWCLQACV